MGIVPFVAGALQRAIGEPLDRLGRDRGVIRRRRKFSGSTLIQTLVLTLLRRPDARPEDFAATAAMLGVEVTPRAVTKRFTPDLAEFLRIACGGVAGQGRAAPKRQVIWDLVTGRIARITPRRKHPGTSQLPTDPNLLEWGPQVRSYGPSETRPILQNPGPAGDFAILRVEYPGDFTAFHHPVSVGLVDVGGPFAGGRSP